MYLLIDVIYLAYLQKKKLVFLILNKIKSKATVLF